MSNDKFEFKQFTINQSDCAMKVGTDAVLLGSWVEIGNASQILDVGCGTGVIAIMMAQKSTSDVVALDIDEAACKQAKENINNSPWPNRVKVYNESLQNFSIIYNSKFDLIVSNPPYFIDSYKSTEMLRNQARHADQLPFEEFIQCSIKLLNPTGKICVILPTKESIIFREFASNHHLHLTKITHVKTKHNKEEKRQLLQFETVYKSCIENTLVIEQEERHCYSNEYKELTKDFYLSFKN
ncbi:MAG: methyltransferase [Bacteroidia bacterium]|nr:methyltransferase [Bacteroidia bacterium]MCZ2248859.1 methyltransferase [Bacteroidia bacterium]